MVTWDAEYYEELEERFSNITDGLNDRIDGIADGTIAPPVEEIAIGSARKMRAASLFFDIVDFTNRSQYGEVEKTKDALHMLDCVIPMVQHLVYDHGGYVEKNTGDGVLAIFTGNDADAANAALDTATASFYVLRHLVNDYLEDVDIPKVDARIGIDLGTVLVARVGTARGSAAQARSFLTVVGSSANLASKLQREMAGPNQIWTGDLIKRNAEEYRKGWFVDETPSGWTWSYLNNSNRVYRIWRYTGMKLDPS